MDCSHTLTMPITSTTDDGQFVTVVSMCSCGLHYFTAVIPSTMFFSPEGLQPTHSSKEQ